VRSVVSQRPKSRHDNESILRITVTAMALFLVIAAASAQTTSTPLYIDGVLRAVATFHRISEGSLPANGVLGKLRD
jgi:hypothetical protein